MPETLLLFTWKFANEQPFDATHLMTTDSLPVLPEIMEPGFESLTIRRVKLASDALQVAE